MTMTTLANELVGTCFICKRRHDNLGYSPDERRSPVKWLCWECVEDTHNGVRSKLTKVYHMPKRQLDEYERRALQESIEGAGDVLDKIGKTDLAEFDEAECFMFCESILTRYADSMRDIVSREVPY